MNNEVPRASQTAVSPLETKPVSGKGSAPSSQDVAKQNLEQALRLITSVHLEDVDAQAILNGIIDKLRKRTIIVSAEDVEKVTLAGNTEPKHLKLPIGKLQNSETSLGFCLGGLLQATQGVSFSREKRHQLIDQVKKANTSKTEAGPDLITDDEITSILRGLTPEERKEIERNAAARIVNDPAPAVPKPPAPHTLDINLLTQIIPRYTAANRHQALAWQGAVAEQLDLALKGGNNQIAPIIAKMMNIFLRIRGRDNKTEVSELAPEIIADIVNNIATYIAVKHNASESIRASSS